MSRTLKNHKWVLQIFKPDEFGTSQWLSRHAISFTELKLGGNGNIRQNTPWSDKFIWEVKRLNNNANGKPIAFRTVGLSDTTIKSRPISAKNASRGCAFFFAK